MRLKGLSVSRNHAALIRLANRVYLFDCNSKNCTTVNNQTISPFRLVTVKENDTLSFANNPAKLTVKDEIR